MSEQLPDLPHSVGGIIGVALKGFLLGFGFVGANAVFALLHWPHL